MEIVVAALFQPLARIVVAMLLPLRVAPAAVVLMNAAAGLAAAIEIARGDLVGGAVLLQLKTLLDNADGQLARASGRTSALGRYLDTEADLVVNAAVFAALAVETDAVALAAAGFVALTLLLSANFNADVLYRRARGAEIVTQPSAEGEGFVARALAGFYSAVFAPQDRVLQGISERRLEHVLRGVDEPRARRLAALAYHDSASMSLLANLGLSTQLIALGICLVAGAPIVYVWVPLAGLALVPLLQVRRERLARAAVLDGAA